MSPPRLAPLLCLALTTANVLAQGHCLRFYGTGTGDIDRLKIPVQPDNPLNLAGSFTIEFWMRTAPADNAPVFGDPTSEDGWTLGHIIVDRDVFGTDVPDYGISLFNGGISFGVRTNAGQRTIYSSDLALEDNTWHHIAAVRDTAAAQLRLYVNGTLRATANSAPAGSVAYPPLRPPSPWPNDAFIVIAAEKHDYDPPNYPSYAGQLDEIRFSNAVRYTTDFFPRMHPHLSDASTVGLFHLDENGPSTPADYTVLNTAGLPNATRRVGGLSPFIGPVYLTDTPTPALGDLDNSGSVNSLDLAVQLAALGLTGPRLPADLAHASLPSSPTPDGLVDSADTHALLNRLGL